MINLIWAQTNSRIIGINGKLPWSIKEEMQYFRSITLGHDILMGSKTFVSMKEKPLPNRFNFVLTRTPSKFEYIHFNNLKFINDISEILDKYQHDPEHDIFIIGGAEIYSIFFNYANRIFRSIIKKEYQGNIILPDYDFSKFNKIKSDVREEFIIEIWERK